MEAILFASTRGNKYPRTNRTDAIIQRVPIQTINGSNYYVSTLTHDGRMEYVGLTVRSKRLLALLCTHVKSTLPRDVWMVLNVCTVKMIEINKIKSSNWGKPLKKKKKIARLCRPFS